MFKIPKAMSRLSQRKLTAGMESTANTTSLISMTAKTSRRGVARLMLPSKMVKNLSPSYSSVTFTNCLQEFRESISQLAGM